MEGFTVLVSLVVLAHSLTDAAYILHRQHPATQFLLADDQSGELSGSKGGLTKEIPAYLSDDHPASLIQLLRNEIGLLEEAYDANRGGSGMEATQKRSRAGWNWVHGGVPSRPTRERSGWGGGYGKK